MVRTVGMAVLLLTLLIGVAFGFAALDLQGLFRPLIGEPEVAQRTSNSDKQAGGEKAVPAQSQGIADRVSQLANELDVGRQSGEKDVLARPSFDIARVSPDGVSVFAGRAGPLERVNVHVGDLLVGTVSADSQGNWTLVTEKKIPDISGELQLTTGAVAEAMEAPASPSHPSPQAAAPITAAEVNKRLVASLKGLVEEARTQNRKEKRTETLPSEAGASEALPANEIREPQKFAEAAVTPDLESSTSGSSGRQTARSRTIPIPVQFVYRESEFTEEGREAVGLLLEYIKLAGLDRVTLTGHADERGSTDLNFELSRDRLNAVRDVLRDGGYGGELVLLPKGESEPFAGVDRSTLPREELFQLDRRVELLLED